MEEEKMGRAGSSSSECRVEETKQNEMRSILNLVKKGDGEISRSEKKNLSIL